MTKTEKDTEKEKYQKNDQKHRKRKNENGPMKKSQPHSRPVTEECDQTARETGAKDEECVRVKAQSSFYTEIEQQPPRNKDPPSMLQMQTLRHKQKRQKTQIHTLITLPA